MDNESFELNYQSHIADLMQRLPNDHAMRSAVGTDFDANGILEREVLRKSGLRDDDFLIDVGCGSGRLAVKLKDWLKGRYVGVDVNRDLLGYASALTGRADWRFELGDGYSIPAAGGVADMVCFFSVFTHLLHEHSYAYLLEAKRVLKARGRVVFSFLEFSSPHLWSIFESNVRDLGKPVPLNMFMSREMFPVWASHLGMKIVDLVGSTTPYIPLEAPVRYDNGRVVEGCVWFGQSLCILEKMD